MNPPSPEASEGRSGWSNGFIVTSNQEPETSRQIAIIYWPQYLQWVGFGLLFGVLGFLGVEMLIKKD